MPRRNGSEAAWRGPASHGSVANRREPWPASPHRARLDTRIPESHRARSAPRRVTRRRGTPNRANLSSLAGSTPFGHAGVLDETVPIGIAVVFHPFERGEQVRPQLIDELAVGRSLKVGCREHDEQRRRVDAAVILSERNFAERRPSRRCASRAGSCRARRPAPRCVPSPGSRRGS